MLDARREKLKSDYIAARGYWVAFNDVLLEHSPDFLEAYMDFAALPARVGPLSERLVELIYVAIDASTTHMFQPGLAVHIRKALEVGASRTELIEVLGVATAQGLASVNQGVSVLVEELALAGVPARELAIPDTPAQQALRETYRARFGDWPDFCEPILKLAPDFFGVLLDLLAAPMTSGALSEKDRAFVECALAAAPTSLDMAALRIHIRRAIRLGATQAELLEVLQLATHLGVHACVIGVPLIAEAPP